MLLMPMRCNSGGVRVSGEWQRQRYAGDGDVIDKDIKLRELDWHMMPCHLMNGDEKYVIVLQHQRIIVQTLQQQTPPCMSTIVVV